MNQSGRRGLAVVGSVVAHLGLAAGVWMARPDRPPDRPNPPVIAVELVAPPLPPPPVVPRRQPPAPTPEPAPVAKAAPKSEPAAKQPKPWTARPIAIRRARAPAPPERIHTAFAATPGVSGFEIGEDELAGAVEVGAGAGAGAGTGGGPGGAGAGARCDMAARLQAALSDDADVVAAARLARASLSRPGSALRVWDGEWTQNPGQAGKGLAGVRQAIALEIAFAPDACKTQSMRGLVLIRLGDTRLALGRSQWRWTDLLEARR